jgi:hypothetical protein
MDWRHEDRVAQLWALIDELWVVEEIEIARIRDLCDENEISCERFIEVWRELCDESHIIINQAEERIH